MLREAAGVLLVFAVVGVFVAGDAPDEWEWRIYRGTQIRLAALAAGVVAWVVGVEDAPLASLNHPPVAPLVEAVAYSWIVVAGTGVVVALLFQRLDWDAIGPGVRALFSLPLHRKLFVGVAAGVTEEVVFRGYLLTRVAELTGSELAGLAVATVAFAGIHVKSRGVPRLVQVSILGVALGGVFLWTGSLLGVVVAHASYNALSLATTGPEDLPDAGGADEHAND